MSDLRYKPMDSNGPCAQMFCDVLARAAQTVNNAELARLGDAWLRGQDRAERDRPRPKDMAERTAEHALQILRRD